MIPNLTSDGAQFQAPIGGSFSGDLGSPGGMQFEGDYGSGGLGEFGEGSDEPGDD
ncbi:MAG TPA: hypothetical protein VK518_15650 [Puia sp.]|nr:hypothetical protein [Puia sp.]